MEYIDPKFHLEVIKTFLNKKILEYRDLGGNDFKTVNQHIDNLEDRQDKNNK